MVPILLRLLRYRQPFGRVAASVMSVSGPAGTRTAGNRPPRASSKSTPGATVIATFASMRAQNVALSFDPSAMSANR